MNTYSKKFILQQVIRILLMRYKVFKYNLTGTKNVFLLKEI